MQNPGIIKDSIKIRTLWSNIIVYVSAAWLILNHVTHVFSFLQVDPQKYGGIFKGFRVSIAEGGLKELARGWSPTLIGYSAQGLGKFGFYELFKNIYSGMLGEVSACYFGVVLD